VNVQIETQGAAVVVKPSGRLDFAAASAFQAQMDEVLSGSGQPPAAVVIDGAGMEYISSAGLRVFLVAARAAKMTNTQFVVCGLTASVREVFEVSGFDRIVTLKATITDALSALERPAN
jgi:anti-anti-sigma factor